MYSRKGSEKRREKRWRETAVEEEASARIVSVLRCPRVVADLLVRRGITDPEAAQEFLTPSLGQLPDPDLMPGIDAAVDRIVRAVRERESIAIFGDYDVDGVASTALMVEFFRFIDYPVRSYIPKRLEEGYGMNLGAVRRLAGEGTQLIITVDNGSSSVDEVALARSLGADVVITDHHLPSDPPPDPRAFVNPWIDGSRYPFPQLAGAGVAFKVIWAIARRFSRSRKVSDAFRRFMLDALAFVALGTVADVVPLRGENRVLAHFGLRALERTSLPGLRALADMVRERSGTGPLTARDIAFRIGPCLNSAGRLGDADLALRLLTTRDPVEAGTLRERLERDNDRRRRIEKEIHAEARDRLLARDDLEASRAIVLAGEGWHPGVIGIVASRLVDEFYRPTLLISLDGDRGKGSARSIPQVQIRDVLEQASSCLEGFGGHAQAAGVTVSAARVDELRRRINDAITVPPSEMVPEIEIDGEYDLSEWTPETLRQLDRLAPFGAGNREPLFAGRGLDVVGAPRLMGRSGDHLSFYVRDGGTALRTVAFGMGALHDEIAAEGARVSVVYQPVLSRWRGEERVELHVREIVPERG